MVVKLVRAVLKNLFEQRLDSKSVTARINRYFFDLTGTLMGDPDLPSDVILRRNDGFSEALVKEYP